MTLKRGKLPAQPIELKFSDFLNTADLPPLPEVFGHSLAIMPGAWGMLGNDQVGDCVLAGAAHETLIWADEGMESQPLFSTNTVVRQYYELTGGDDTGLAAAAVAKWRQKTGLTDDNGVKHKIAAYMALDPANIEHLFYAVYLFGAVGLGLRLPNIAVAQFKAGEPWDFSKGTTSDGGHYVPFAGRRPGMLHVVTWGQRYPMLESSLTPDFVDEAIVYVSEEALANQKSPEGFDYAQLNSFLDNLA